jgi:hypothetical protein
MIPDQKNYYEKLLARVKHDREPAERLIEFERKKAPDASIEELCKRAIERLEWDNR